MRRLAAWFDGKFAAEVTQNLYGEKYLRRLTRRGNPDPAAIRTGYTALRYHLDYIGWLAETRKWLAGDALVAGRLHRRGASVDAGLHRRTGLVDFAAAGTGMPG